MKWEHWLEMDYKTFITFFEGLQYSISKTDFVLHENTLWWP